MVVVFLMRALARLTPKYEPKLPEHVRGLPYDAGTSYVAFSHGRLAAYALVHEGRCHALGTASRYLLEDFAVPLLMAIHRDNPRTVIDANVPASILAKYRKRIKK